MKKYIYSALAILIGITSVHAADYTQWVDDPADCTVVYNSVNCGADYVCGVETTNNFPYCASLEDLTAPTFPTSSNSVYGSGLGAGYVLNCTADVTNGNANPANPYCSNGGNYYCNRSSLCNGYYRDTVCLANNFSASGAGAFTCSESCQSGRLDCTGDATEGSCSVRKNITSYPTGSNNHYGTTCDAAQVSCNSGYLDCDASGTGATSGTDTATGNGCEVRVGVTSYNAAANNTYNWSCGAVCKSGYYDCDAEGVTLTNGCEVQSGVTSYAAHSTVNSSCTSVCSGNYLDCNGDLVSGGAGDGCEVLNGGACTLAGLDGIIDGCSMGVAACVIDPIEFKTGVNTENATEDPLLWGTQYGTGDLASMSKNGDEQSQFTIDNEGDVGMGTDSPHVAAALDMSEKGKGVLFPELTTIERDALNGGVPPIGLIIFNTDINALELWNGTWWMAIGKQSHSNRKEFILPW